MPYFQRKPVEGLVDTVRSQFPMPGLPSRVRALPGAVTTDILPDNPFTATTGIIEQATAVLASERPSASPAPTGHSDPGSVASMQSTQVSELQAKVNALIEQLVALVAQPALPATAPPLSALYFGQQPASGAAEVTVEPAPVLAPAGPVTPGGTAQICISLVNEDEQPAQIVFFSTGLVGEDGERIAAERVSFQPRELMLSPGKTGEVIVSVVIPAQTRCGVYSGLIRASKLDYLHAVLVVQVDYP
jgi:hypothetical protein